MMHDWVVWCRSKKVAKESRTIEVMVEASPSLIAIEDHASCWVHKDLTVTTKQIQALLTAARASGRKDEY